LLLHCYVGCHWHILLVTLCWCYHQHLFFTQRNVTNNDFCSRIVLCKFRFSMSTFF
jgi:hypothetical protein